MSTVEERVKEALAECESFNDALRALAGMEMEFRRALFTSSRTITILVIKPRFAAIYIYVEGDGDLFLTESLRPWGDEDMVCQVCQVTS